MPDSNEPEGVYVNCEGFSAPPPPLPAWLSGQLLVPENVI